MSYDLPVSYQYSRDPALRQAYWGGRITQEHTDELAKISRQNAEMQAQATLAAGAMVSSRIQAANIASMEAMRENTAMLNNALEAGFQALETGLQAVESGVRNVARAVGEMNADMNMGFARLDSAILASSTSICERLDVINNTLSNPRYTQARELYREAEKNFGKGFYEEALGDALKSVEINKADYFSWFLLGKVYLFGAGEFSAVADLDKALESLGTAVKYITPDARNNNDAKRLAAEIMFHLGLARLYKSNVLSIESSGSAEAARYFDEAQRAFDQSGAYSDKMLEARFMAAWCKAQPAGGDGTAARDEGGALADLEAAITGDALYAVKTAQDGGFALITDGFNALMERLRAALAVKVQAALIALEEPANQLQRLMETYGGKLSEDIAPSWQKIERFLAANPAVDQAGYVDLARVLPAIEQCAVLTGNAVTRIKNEQAAEQAAAWEALVRMFGIEGTTVTGYRGPDGDVTIPKGVTSIGEKAFSQNKGITSVIIPEGVTSIGARAFYGCDGLTSVTIPPSVTSIGGSAFSGCSNLTSVTIPPSVTTIEAWAFSGCSNLTSVIIPPGVTTIEEYAFYGCKGLTSFIIPQGVTTIGKSAFSGCKGLTSVTIPPGVTTIGEYAFYGCEGLTSVTFPPGVTSIGEYAFYDNKLTEVVIPNSVTSIGKYAFANRSIFTITIGANVNVGEKAWDYNFDSAYNSHGKKAGKYVPKNLDLHSWTRHAVTWEGKGKYKDAVRWQIIGSLLGLVPLIGGFVVGHWFIGIILALVTALVVAFAFIARGWGILALAVIGGSIALGIQVGHPVIFGIIGVIAGLVVWSKG
jgi:tetratricopeptide (TPR) repeat protein